MMLTERHWRLLGRAWLLLCVAVCIALALALPRARFNTSVMDLLPKEEHQQWHPELRAGLLANLDRQLVWLVSLPAGKDGEAAVTEWSRQLQAIDALALVKGAQPELAPAWQAYLQQMAWQHLPPAARARLEGGASVWSQWVLGQIYSPFGGVSRAEWQSDPMLLTRAAVLEQQSPMQLGEQGWLSALGPDGRRWYLVRAELNLSAFDMARNRQLLAELTRAEDKLKQDYPGAELLRRGTLFYSQHASTLAEQDISTIGLGSLFGVVLLIWLAFRSLRALLLSLLPLATGMLWGLGAVLLVFGEIHVFTLVISTSLIGISIDYALHFMSERRLHGHETPAQTRAHLLPGLSLALLTTLIGYALLWLAPFPGLQQLAVCALAGLLAAFLTVLLLFPAWLGELSQGPLPIRRWQARWIAAWREPTGLRRWLPLLVLVISAIGVSRLVVDDDIQKLQPLPHQLQAQEHQIQQLTGQQGGMTGYLVVGRDGEQALTRLETLAGHLEQARQRGQLEQFVAISQWLPSLARQQGDYHAIMESQPSVIAALKGAGLPVEAKTRPFSPLTPEAWLASPVSEGSRLLWHALPDGRVGIWVPLAGIHDTAALARLADKSDGVVWQDQRSQWSQLFADYRIKLAELLLVAVLLVTGLLWRRVGWRVAARILLVNALAIAMGLALLGFSQQPLTLFGVLALSLIFGIGIDYGLFFAHCGEDPGRQQSTLLAILLAHLTTLLAFGLLALSHTPAIAGFGIVLSGGIFTAFLLSPMVLAPRPAAES
ncbi:MMPL family transporter [Aeromonas enteropelogenes]|uniref:MMPL family transporter n=1 Tax=Aeromonas enteropelogenes TaxID=29489 RepID=UPI003BA3DAEC